MYPSRLRRAAARNPRWRPERRQRSPDSSPGRALARCSPQVRPAAGELDNPSVPRARERMEPCRAVRIWGLGQTGRHKPACRCAVCPFAVLLLDACPEFDENDKYRLERKCDEVVLTRGEVPVDGLGGAPTPTAPGPQDGNPAEPKGQRAGRDGGRPRGQREIGASTTFISERGSAVIQQRRTGRTPRPECARRFGKRWAERRSSTGRAA